MVENIKSSPNEANNLARHKVIVCELVGPPGSGKTTLSSELAHYPQIQPVSFPLYRNINYLPFFIRNTVSMLPTFTSLYRNRNGRWLTRDEAAWLVILKGWHRLLQHQKVSQDKHLLLDQGPVFFLYWLYGFGPGTLKTQCAQPWWKEMIEHWAETLDAVVWIDAPDYVLIERIVSREKGHDVKDKQKPDIERFIADTRAALKHVISAMTADAPGLKVFYIDTALAPPTELAQDIFRKITEETYQLLPGI